MDLIKANMNTTSSQQGKQDDKHLPVDVPVVASKPLRSRRGPTSTTTTRTSTPSSSFCCRCSSVFIIWIPAIGVIIALGFFLIGITTKDHIFGFLFFVYAFWFLIAAAIVSALGCIGAACFKGLRTADIKQDGDGCELIGCVEMGEAIGEREPEPEPEPYQ
uniref:Transmembrane protein n=1 Tax=Chaetoceros debilis TaxID=122233 RepID=A0A7S3Q561_9STRA|mmetsp:Transcript_3300/g.4873  ORF Transcript_3300/g.4873 Transcript_3300/m.4873 type:complete len:161 (-) Transcript_3300:62-544(-)